MEGALTVAVKGLLGCEGGEDRSESWRSNK